MIQHVFHTFSHPDRVGAGFLEQQDADRLVAIEPRDRFPILEPVVDGSDIAQQHEVAASRCRAERYPPDLLDSLEFSQGPQRIAIPPAPDRSAGSALIRGIERAGDVVDGEAVTLQQAGVDLHVDLPLEPAGQRGFGDTVDLLEAALEHRLGEFLERREVGPSRDRQRDNRLGAGIRSQNDRSRSQLGQFLTDVVELFPHVEGSEVHVRPPGETQRDEGDPLPGNALDALDAGNATHHPLNPFRDEALDFRRPDVRIPRIDDELRVGDTRQEIDGEAPEGDATQEHHREDEHGDRYGSADRSARYGHPSGAHASGCSR